MSVNTNQTNANATTSFFAPASGGGGGGGSNFPNGATLGVAGSGGAVFGVSTMIQNQNFNIGNFYTPVRYNYNPPSANVNDQVAMVLTYNPQNAGQTAIALGAKGNGNAFVGAVWEGFITMPLELWGAAIHAYSDNETFLYMDGKAGAIGSISTGVQLLSADNILNTITDPTKQYTADTTALFSTLQSLYPDCFVPPK